MHFSIRKNISPKKQLPLSGFINVLILIIAVPVILIAIISISIYMLFLWLKNFIVKKKIINTEVVHYHQELDLIHNKHVQIIMVEDELDSELTQLNETWMEKVYSKETCLYRARTIPVIPTLEGAICCYYCKEQEKGLLLQVLPGNKFTENSSAINSQLVFLDYRNFEITLIDETGPFYLYNDERNNQLIKGFNKKENISLEIFSS